MQPKNVDFLASIVGLTTDPIITAYIVNSITMTVLTLACYNATYLD
jgi:hypothetical protein